MRKILLVDQYSKASGNDGASLLRLMQTESTELHFAIDDTFPFESKDIVSYVVFKRCFGSDLPIFKKAFNYYFSLRRLLKVVKEKKFDWVILQWFPIQLLDLHFVKAIRKFSKVCIMVHDVIPFNTKKNEIKNLTKIYLQSDLLILQGDYSYNLFLKVYSNIPIEKVKKTNSAFVDTKSYYPIEKSKARMQLGIDRKKRVFLFFGTVKEEKCLDSLIVAFSNHFKNNKDSLLLIAGSLPLFLQKKYDDLVSKYLDKESSKVCFRHMTEEEKKLYFSASDVLVLPYKTIYQSGSAQVGLLFGMPIIATRLEGFGKAIQNGVNGITIENPSVEEIECALNRISTSDLEAFGKNSRQILERDFSLAEKAKDICVFLDGEK